MIPVAHTLQRFCGVVEQTLGLDLQTRGSHDLERMLREQSLHAHLTTEAYVERLAQGGAAEWQCLANTLTVGETYFFRHLEQLQACCDLIESQCAKVGGQRRVRVLSAGCSSGEEAYSLAMLLHDRGIPGEAVEIVGLDVNPIALARARSGSYSQWSLRETDQTTVARWFHSERGKFRVRQQIQDGVKFVQGNLVASLYEVRGDYDVVLCRNVLMYFSPAQFQRAARRLVQALRPGGALFLGHAESLRGIQVNAEAVHELGAFFYRTSSNPSASVGMDNSAYSMPDVFGGRFEPAVRAPVEVMRTEPSRLEASLEASRGSLASVEELLRQERFADALVALEGVGSIGPTRGVWELCQGMLLVYNNRFSDAARLLASLINEESVAAEAHYALALCHEAESNISEALRHHRLAAHLDPTFAMPRLHLGLLYKRLGQQRTARRELLQARALLLTETPERMLWFGGGSSRAHLVDVCEDALHNTDERR